MQAAQPDCSKNRIGHCVKDETGSLECVNELFINIFLKFEDPPGEICGLSFSRNDLAAALGTGPPLQHKWLFDGEDLSASFVDHFQRPAATARHTGQGIFRHDHGQAGLFH